MLKLFVGDPSAAARGSSSRGVNYTPNNNNYYNYREPPSLSPSSFLVFSFSLSPLGRGKLRGARNTSTACTRPATPYPVHFAAAKRPAICTFHDAYYFRIIRPESLAVR